MNEMIKMVVVLTVLSALSGGLLAAIKDNTAERIEIQELQFVKGPAIASIMAGAENDPLTNRFKLAHNDEELNFFVGVYGGQANTVAFESSGKGYGGDVGLMVGVNVESDELIGVGVTTHAETPGLGAKAKDDPKFAAQFKGMSLTSPIKVKNDGGQVDAIGGATITSRAVAQAATNASEIYQALKPQIVEEMKSAVN
ncbi:MAG: RnfABCDGE type electron transport complex subunit G [Desulfobacterales bacterium]|jgi:electron transport complex protein RnfG